MIFHHVDLNTNSKVQVRIELLILNVAKFVIGPIEPKLLLKSLKLYQRFCCVKI